MDKLQIKSLLNLSESEWLEFKIDQIRPELIGENISAISNSIALLDKEYGYILWGVNDNKEIVGTKFKPRDCRVGKEELENWLLRSLDPQVDFSIHEEIIDEKRIVIFKISPARRKPVRFRGIDYIRIGSYTKKLKDHSGKERILWRMFENKTFEEDIAYENIGATEALNLIDYPSYFKKIGQPIPENHSSILERLGQEKIITQSNFDHYSITNLGAMLFAYDLNLFRTLRHKIPRVIVYASSDKTHCIKDKYFKSGYAIEFENIVEYIDDQVPKNQEIKKALREEVSMFPILAIRELVANSLIHQDFYSKGSTLIEIFPKRIEISNSGKPLIETLRFIDEPPKSRNEMVADFMRRLNISEQRGSGIDKVIKQIEFYQLPAPSFHASKLSTIATLFAVKPFSKMSKEERVRACYQHACLQVVSDTKMTNATLRERFGIEARNYPMVSNVIKEAIEKDFIKKNTIDNSYVPFWHS